MTMLLDPRLADCRRIFLNGLCVQASIGFHAHERQQAQRLRMNVELFVPIAQSTSQSDAVDDVLDYDFIRNVVARRIARGHIGRRRAGGRLRLRSCRGRRGSRR